jgi:Peptidase C13 family
MALIRYLIAGLRLVLFRPVPAERFDIGFATLAVMILATISVSASSELQNVDADFRFNAYGLILAIGLWAVTAAAIAVVLGLARRSQAMRLFAAIAAASFWISLVCLGLFLVWGATAQPLVRIAGSSLVAYGSLAIFLLQFVALFVVVQRLPSLFYGRRAPVLATCLFLVTTAIAIAAPSQTMFVSSGYSAYDRGYWPFVEATAERFAQQQGWITPAQAAPDDEIPPVPPVDVETVLGNQNRLIDTQFAALLPERPGKRDLYLVSLGGDASQAVFRREVRSVDKLFGERFGTWRRSITLINSEATLEDTPLGSPRNLGAVLKRLGTVMNKQDDVLFLFLTSHGSPKRFVTSFDDFPFRDLRPRQLRAMLDASGIKHRVVVVSACFSGSFIPALASPETLVITAARPDRTSFGCADENDWTYFGDAYFNHALRKVSSFTGAFKIATDLVASWEKRDDVTPSEPQISSGTRIEAILAELAAAQQPANTSAPKN